MVNHGKKAAMIDVLPTVWFRNVWTWGKDRGAERRARPSMRLDGESGVVHLHHDELGEFRFHAWSDVGVEPEWLFTENESNPLRTPGSRAYSTYFKDAFHRHVVQKEKGAVNPMMRGTKAAARWKIEVPAGGTVTVRCRLHAVDEVNGIVDYNTDTN